jgi:hypothetical protein
MLLLQKESFLNRSAPEIGKPALPLRPVGSDPHLANHTNPNEPDLASRASFHSTGVTRAASSGTTSALSEERGFRKGRGALSENLWLCNVQWDDSNAVARGTWTQVTQGEESNKRRPILLRTASDIWPWVTPRIHFEKIFKHCFSTEVTGLDADPILRLWWKWDFQRDGSFVLSFEYTTPADFQLSVFTANFVLKPVTGCPIGSANSMNENFVVVVPVFDNTNTG